MDKIKFEKNFWKKISEAKKEIHFVVIATKPDLIKQFPIFQELKKRKLDVFLIHTGQHFDFCLSGGMEKEFNLDISVNLQISGSLHQKFSQIISRLGEIFAKIVEMKKTVIPWVHGDTFTAHAASIAGFLYRFSCVHVESGLRTFTPQKKYFQEFINLFSKDKKLAVKFWKKICCEKKNFETGSNEPFPEQWNTRSISPASGIFLAPTKLNFNNLKQEGFSEKKIFVVGNSVIDATKFAIKNSKKSKIFNTFPVLKNKFIRFCIHRQENCNDKNRFLVIFSAIEKILKMGETVLLISLFATESAIDKFGLRHKINELQKKYSKKFIFSPVWPKYSDVIAAMKNCKLCVTDSGSMQEEMNFLGIPCATLRFGSDRPESFFNGGNIPAPPISSEIIFEILDNILKSPPKKFRKIYGNSVAKKSVNEFVKFFQKYKKIFWTEETRIFKKNPL